MYRLRRDGHHQGIRQGYGVDRYTAFDGLSALGFEPPTSEQRWVHRPPAIAPRKAEPGADATDGACWIMLDGRLLFVAGCTSGGAPYGTLAEELRTL
jgi:hypothetical protein